MGRCYLLLALLLGLPILGYASVPTATSNAVAPLVLPPYTWQGLTLSGYLDTSYNFLVNSNHYISGNFDRDNDIEPNGITLQQLSVTVARTPPEGLGGLLNLILGRDAFHIAPLGMNPYIGSQTIGFAIPQLFLQWSALATTSYVGVFNSEAGFENYSSPQNIQFSHSILDQEAQPGVVLGGRITTSHGPWGLVLGINNGWSGIDDTSRRKTLEMSIQYTPDPEISLMFNIYNGQERLQTNLTRGPTGIRDFIDIIASWETPYQINLAANYDYGEQNRALKANGQIGMVQWQGIAGYITYIIDQEWHIALRSEIFNDPEGFCTGVNQLLKEATVTLGYRPWKHFELRAETRHDFSNAEAFFTKHQGTANFQQSYALDAVYQF